MSINRIAGTIYKNLDNVGIGTIFPIAPLHIYHAGTNISDIVRIDDETAPDNTLFIIKNDGTIGIGTTIPRQKLDINGNLLATDITVGTISSGNVTVGTISSGNITVGTISSGNVTIGTISLGNITTGTISSGDITATNATISGTIITSNLTVLGSNTVINTYTTSTSNFSICNITGTGPALSVYQQGSGLGYPIADFYDIDVSTIIPALRIADGGNIGIGTSIPLANLHIYNNNTKDSFRVDDETSPFIINADGNVGIGTTTPTSRLTLGAGTTAIAPIRFSPGINLGTATAGTIEYDGTTMFVTPNTNYGRATIPATIYTSGIGTAGIAGNTNYPLFPTNNDTITLSVGTYLVTAGLQVGVSGSTIAALVAFDIRGGGNATGNFSWRGSGSPLNGSISSNSATGTHYPVAATNLGTQFNFAPSTLNNPRQHVIIGKGILRITGSGTIIPSYRFTNTLTGGTTTLSPDNYMIIQTLSSNGTGIFGPTGSGWN